MEIRNNKGLGKSKLALEIDKYMKSHFVDENLIYNEEEEKIIKEDKKEEL